MALEQQKLLAQVKEEEEDAADDGDDDGAFSQATEKEAYKELMNDGTERTQSVYKMQPDEEIKNEWDSANFTVNNIRVSSPGDSD